MRTSIQNHVGKKVGLVHLTGLGTGNSDPYRNFLFRQVKQIISGTVAGQRFLVHVPRLIRPTYSLPNEEKIYLVAFGMSDFTELKTPSGVL
jgi:hypothetical protein